MINALLHVRIWTRTLAYMPYVYLKLRNTAEQFA